jgi:TolB-like 6-blade propeller-like
MKQLILLFCLGMSYAPYSQPPANDTIIFSRFPAETKLQPENLFPLKNEYIRSIYVEENGITTWSINKDQGYFFRPYNLQGQPLNKGYIGFGSGQFEATGAISGGCHRGMYWMYDVGTAKIITARPQKGSSDNVSLKEYDMPEFYYSASFLDSLQLIASGRDDMQEKLHRIQLPSLKIVSAYGSYTNPPGKTPVNTWRESFTAFIFNHPDLSIAAMACRYTDQVDFIDLKTGKSRVVKGPENFPAMFGSMYSGGRDRLERTEDTRFAFVNGTATKNYLYLLYSGNHEVDGAGNLNSTGKKVYVYDWQGNPVRALTFPNYISCIGVNDNDSLLYAFDTDREMIIRAAL